MRTTTSNAEETRAQEMASESPQSTPVSVPLSHRPVKILIVEDDLTMKALWDYVIGKAFPRSQIMWAKTEEGAEKAIELRSRNNTSFDLIISDIYLGGDKTGVDLWQHFRNEPTKFILTSVITRKKFLSMLSDAKEAPLFLEKPISTADAIKALTTLLEEEARLN